MEINVRINLALAGLIVENGNPNAAYLFLLHFVVHLLDFLDEAAAKLESMASSSHIYMFGSVGLYTAGAAGKL